MNTITRAVTNQLRMRSLRGFHLSHRAAGDKESSHQFSANPLEHYVTWKGLLEHSTDQEKRLNTGNDKLRDELKKWGEEVTGLGDKLDKLDCNWKGQFERLDTKLSHYFEKLDTRLDTQYDKLSTRAEGIDSKLAQIDTRTQAIDARLIDAQQTIAEHKGILSVVGRLLLLPLAAGGLKIAYDRYAKWRKREE